ncbi:MAG: hypothetical protein EBS06_09290 [Proteobacteria bacterium]|nr:hypothetical protein [Pseudomonadota bacterium]
MELSIRAYARHRGVTEAAVRKAIRQGRVSKGKNGKINPKTADKEWGQNTDPAQIKAVFTEEKPDYSQNSIPNATNGPSYQQSRAIKEAYGAKLLRLQFEKESKKLISIDDVKVSAFNAARMTRDRILNIPDRVIPQLVGKTDIFEMKEILKAELIKALEELSKVHEKL